MGQEKKVSVGERKSSAITGLHTTKMKVEDQVYVNRRRETNKNSTGSKENRSRLLTMTCCLSTEHFAGFKLTGLYLISQNIRCKVFCLFV